MKIKKDPWYKYNYALINSFFIVLAFYFAAYFIGLRSLDAGNDTPSYVYAFSKIQNLSDAYAMGRTYFGSQEPSFWFLAGLVKTFTNNPQIWLFVNFSLIFILSAIAYKKITKILSIKGWGYLLFFLFFTYELVFFGNAMRQSIAVPLTILSYVYCYENHKIKATISFLFAVSFHFSSLLFLPLLFLLFIKKLDKYMIIFLLISIIMGIYSNEIISFIIKIIAFDPLTIKYNLYIAKGAEGEMRGRTVLSSINMLIALSVSIITLIFLKENKFLYIITLYILICFILFWKFTIIDIRILFYYMFLYPFVFKLILTKGIKENTFSLVCLVLLFLLIMVSTFINESARYTLGLI